MKEDIIEMMRRAFDSLSIYDQPETVHIGRKLLADRVLGVGSGVFVLAFFMYV